MNETLKQPNPTKVNDKYLHYKKVLFKILTILQDARIEFIEGGHTVMLGDHRSDLTGVIEIYDPSFYYDIICNGSIGAAEAYFQHKWDSPNLTQVIQALARNQDQLDALEKKTRWLTKFNHEYLKFIRVNTEKKAKQNIMAHYDLGNDFYRLFLDANMQYSCARFTHPNQDLTAAQHQKIVDIATALDIQPGDRVLEIGSGWGGLAIYLVKAYDCHVTTTTISDAQYEYVQQQLFEQNLQNRVRLLKQDYRQLREEYDKIVSIEMIEAVGHRYIPQFFQQCHQCLKPNGTLVLQAITMLDHRYDNYRKNIDFIQKYIFPGGCLPSLSIILESIAQCTDMTLYHTQEIGQHYAMTLQHWRERCQEQHETFQKLGFDETFQRLWHYYLSYCEGAFLEKAILAYQLTFHKPKQKGSPTRRLHDARPAVELDTKEITTT